MTKMHINNRGRRWIFSAAGCGCSLRVIKIRRIASGTFTDKRTKTKSVDDWV